MGSRLSSNVFGGEVIANAAARPSDIAELDHRLCPGATLLLSAPCPMAFFSSIAADSDQDAAGRLRLA